MSVPLSLDWRLVVVFEGVGGTWSTLRGRPGDVGNDGQPNDQAVYGEAPQWLYQHEPSTERRVKNKF